MESHGGRPVVSCGTEYQRYESIFAKLLHETVEGGCGKAIFTSCVKASDRSPGVPLPLLPEKKLFHTADVHFAFVIAKRDPTFHNRVGFWRQLGRAGGVAPRGETFA